MRYERVAAALLGLAALVWVVSNLSIPRWALMVRPFIELCGAIFEAFRYPLLAACAVLALVGFLKWLRRPL